MAHIDAGDAEVSTGNMHVHVGIDGNLIARIYQDSRCGIGKRGLLQHGEVQSPCLDMGCNSIGHTHGRSTPNGSGIIIFLGSGDIDRLLAKIVDQILGVPMRHFHVTIEGTIIVEAIVMVIVKVHGTFCIQSRVSIAAFKIPLPGNLRAGGGSRELDGTGHLECGRREPGSNGYSAGEITNTRSTGVVQFLSQGRQHLGGIGFIGFRIKGKTGGTGKHGHRGFRLGVTDFEITGCKLCGVRSIVIIDNCHISLIGIDGNGICILLVNHAAIGFQVSRLTACPGRPFLPRMGCIGFIGPGCPIFHQKIHIAGVIIGTGFLIIIIISICPVSHGSMKVRILTGKTQINRA